VKVISITGGVLASNGYVIYDKEHGESFIIDPGYKGRKFLKIVSEFDLTLKGILLTHHHHDHVGGVDEIKALTSCPVYMHPADLRLYNKHVDALLENGDKLKLGDEELTVMHTPGHTKGSICLYSEQSRIAFTGDTLFEAEIGRTDLIDGSPDEMKNSICNVIGGWSNEITIYPGHGDSCTMEYVRKNNPEYLYCFG